LDTGGALATNREVAAHMQTGQPAESLIIDRMFQNGFFEKQVNQDNGRTDTILLQLLEQQRITNTKLNRGLIQETKNWSFQTNNEIINELNQETLHR